MDHRKPLLSGGTHEYFPENDFIIRSSSFNDQTVMTEMGLTTSKGNNRVADLSWSFPSLTMDEVLNLKRTYETLAMLSPKDSMISRVTFTHYFKLGKVLGDKFFHLLDKDGDGKINLNEFLGGLAICLHGSFEEKSRLLFKMFDTNGDDLICEEDLNTLLPFIIKACTSGTSFPGIIPSSQVNKGLTMDFDEDPANLIRNLFASYDKKKTGKLTLDDFCNWIQAYPSFVHAVFQCDFFINFMSPRYSMESHPDIKESSKYPGLQSQTWMDEEMEVDKIMQVTQEMQLNNARYLWKPCFPTSASAKVPGTRFKHTAIFYRGCVYLLGGRGKQNTYKDLWRYFVDENFWEKLQAEGPGPPALQEHTAVVLENLMYVFGGAVSSDATIPLWCLNLDKLCWISLPKRRVGPSNRRGHSAVMHYDSMYVFGGFSDTVGSSNELWRFDTERDDWALVKPQSSRSENIPPRYSHAATVVNNAMWIFGGFESLERKNDLWRWDFELSFWSRAKFKQGPPQLSGHSMGKVADSIIVFGGESNNGLSNDLWRYSFENYKWAKVTPYSGIGPPVRSFQAMVVLSPFALYKKIKAPFQESNAHTVNDYFVRNVNGSKRSLGSKSNSADNILNADKELSAGLSASSRMGSRPHSVIEQMCHNFQEMDTLAPVDVNVGSSIYGTSSKDRTLSLGRKEEDRRNVFQIEEYTTGSSTEDSSNYCHRRFWSLILIGGRGKLSVDMHKTSVDLWECEIGKGPEIPPVNVPDVAEVDKRKYLLPAQKAKVPYDRLQTPESPVRISKRKLNAYDELEVTDISDEVCFESSPEQRPKLQEARRLLANR